MSGEFKLQPYQRAIIDAFLARPIEAVVRSRRLGLCGYRGDILFDEPPVTGEVWTSIAPVNHTAVRGFGGRNIQIFEEAERP